MVRLNSKQLPQKELDALFVQLNLTLGELSAQQTNHFLSELLGKEERIMLAKRLAVIILLIEGRSLYKVASLLKVSPTMASEVKHKLDSGAYDSIVSVLGKSKKNYYAILETLDSILHLGGILPHYNGIERYRGL